MWWMMRGFDGIYGGGWMWLGGILMFLFWAGVIALVIWGIIKISKQNTPFSPHTPLDIAKARYARGEITKEEFDQIKKDVG